jgi:thioesterase domain-containing protein
VPHALLVHGGGHGAWCWTDVQRYLDDAGVPSTAFDLPGAGADPTPRSGIDLSDYINATLAQIDAIDDDVILVGHSIAGLTLPGAIAAREDRIVHAMFLAALVCDAAEPGIESIPADRRPSYYEMAQASGDDTFQPSFSAAWNRFFPSLNEESARTVYASLTPQPLGPYLQPNPVGMAKLRTPRSYVLLEDDRTFPTALARTFAAKAGVEPVIRAGDHCWMLTDPYACATAIAEVALPGAPR